MKKIAGDIIILHMCTKNHNHMFGSWDMEWDDRAFPSSLLRTVIAHNHLPFFKIFSGFTHFCPNFQLFCSFLTFSYPFSEQALNEQNFISFWAIFALLLSPITTQNIKILKKWKKHLYMCTKTHDHMTYTSWDMKNNRQKFLSFWAIFCLITQKIKILKKWKKKSGDMIFVHMCTKNDNHMMYGSWDTEHDRQNFLSF